MEKIEKIDTSGFYKKMEDGSWAYAKYEVVAPDYTLSRKRHDEIGDKENKEGWVWYDEAPKEYIEWQESFKLKEYEV